MGAFFLFCAVLLTCVASYIGKIWYGHRGLINEITVPYSESLGKVISPREDESRTRKILIWNVCPGFSRDCGFGIGNTPFIRNNCSVHNCDITIDKHSLAVADAVLFHMGPHGAARSPKKLPKRAFKEQIFIYYLFEAPLRTKLWTDLRQFGNFFNLTISYLNDSRTDIIIPHGTIVPRPAWEKYTKPDISKLQMKGKPVAWLVSNCVSVRSQRHNYVKMLSKYIPVDIYGECGTLKCAKNRTCYSTIAKQYSFYLAFENSFCKDYRTEKIYRTLNYDIVPVILGGANYSAYLPHKSHINVMDYRSPKHLAEYLKYLIQNRTAYLEVFKWKETYKSRAGYSTKPAAACKLCEILHNTSYRFKSALNVYEYWYGGGQCIDGKAEKRLLGL